MEGYLDPAKDVLKHIGEMAAEQIGLLEKKLKVSPPLHVDARIVILLKKFLGRIYLLVSCFNVICLPIFN